MVLLQPEGLPHKYIIHTFTRPTHMKADNLINECSKQLGFIFKRNPQMISNFIFLNHVFCLLHRIKCLIINVST